MIAKYTYIEKKTGKRIQSNTLLDPRRYKLISQVIQKHDRPPIHDKRQNPRIPK